MALGLMQPYLFPYLGYFQLMDYVDIYVYCGNYQYIKNGWINRNRIFINAKENETHYFSFSVEKGHYAKNINERYYSNLKKDCDKLKRILFQIYKKATNFEEAYGLIESILGFENNNVAYFNMNANDKIAKYLGIKTKITCTDIIEEKAFWEKFQQLNYEDRVIYICKYFNEKRYVNAINGMSLYRKEYFLAEGIELGFIKMDEISYPQFKGLFVPNLSILDVIMHNKIQEIRKLLKGYRIV